jgi:hypothetical protein
MVRPEHHDREGMIAGAAYLIVLRSRERERQERIRDRHPSKACLQGPPIRLHLPSLPNNAIELLILQYVNPWRS